MERWKTAAIIASGIYAVIEIVSVAGSGATTLTSRIPAVASFLTSIPYFIPTLTFVLGVIVGVVGLPSLGNGPRKIMPNQLEGCIEYDEVHWRFSSKIKNKSPTKFFVRSSPYCPECRTELEKERKSPVGVPTKRPLWACPECGEGWSRTDDAHSEVEKIARTRVEEIVETRGKEFSLDTLTNKFYDQNEGNHPTGKDIWRLYVENKEDEYATTACFHGTD